MLPWHPDDLMFNTWPLLVIAVLALAAPPVRAAPQSQRASAPSAAEPSKSSTDSALFDDLAARADAAHAANQLDEAARLYGEALKLRPDWLEGRFALGTVLYGLDRWGEAKEQLERVTAGQKEAPGAAWAFKGLCEFRIEDYATAFTDLEHGQKLGIGSDPQLKTVVQFHLALLLIRSEQFEHAFKILESFALQKETQPEVIVALGLAVLRMPYLPPEVPAKDQQMVVMAGAAGYEYARTSPKMRPAFDALVAKYPDVAAVHYARGIVLLVDDKAGAIAEFEKTLQLDPQHVAAMLQIAFYYIEAGAQDKARSYAEQAVRIAPKFFACHVALGQVEMASGQTDAAIEQLEEAATLAPDSPQVYFHLARAYHMAARREDAAKARAKFSELDQHDRAAAGQ